MKSRTKSIRRPAQVRRAEEVNLFDKVAEEVLHGDRALFDSLSQVERSTVLEWLSTALADGEQNNVINRVLWETDFIRQPLTPEKFLTDDHYLGGSCKDLSQKWMDDLLYVLDVKNRVMEFVLTGATGTGKCSHKDTIIPTGVGLLTAEEIYHRKEPILVQSESGMRRITSRHCEGLTDTIKVVTKHGHEFEGRPNHRVRVLRNLDAEWVELKDLKAGDCLLQKPAMQFGRGGVPGDVAELMGWVVAEGCPSKTSAAMDLPKHEAEYVLALAGKVFPSEKSSITKLKVGSCYRVTLRDREFVELVGGERRSRTWEIPRIVRESCKDSLCRFLRGYISGEGSVNKNVLEITTMSPRLSKQLRAVLTYLGYDVSVKASKASYVAKSGERIVSEGHRYRMLIVGRKSLLRFMDEIGFAEPCQYKTDRLTNELGEENPNSDRGFSFNLSNEDALKLRDLHPLRVAGVDKDHSPRRILSCLVGRVSGCTQRLLESVAQYGCLPPVLADIAERSTLFDTVASTSRSKAECYDLTVDGDPSYVSDGFISHNTTAGMAAVAYKIYWLSCLKNPHKYYGLLEGGAIYFGIYSITKKQVNDAGYFRLRGYVDRSPYFKYDFPRSMKIDSKLVFEKQPLQVISGSQSLHAIGLDLFSIALDEANFMRTKVDETGKMLGQAYELYNSTYTRIVTRFLNQGGSIPGILVLISSRNLQTSFLEEHLGVVSGGKYRPGMRGMVGGATYVSDYSLWDIKPQHKFSSKKFRVEVGDRVSRSRILRDGEEVRDGAAVVDVPENLRKFFDADIDQALRDLAGVATLNISPLIQDRQSVYAAVDHTLVHPFTRDEVSLHLDDELKLESFFNVSELCHIRNSRWIPKVDPERMRYVHVDIGLTGDALGISMVHQSGSGEVEVMNADGTFSKVTKPTYAVDFMLKIRPPPGGEIPLFKIRSFILFLRQFFYLRSVTFDGFQSADSVQLLKKDHVQAFVVSIDRDDKPYLTLRNALFERRIKMYSYLPFQNEVIELERDVATRKVDHPEKSPSTGLKGSKDVGDAVAGALFCCTIDKDAFKPSPVDEVRAREKESGVDWQEVVKNLELQ